VSRKPGLSDVGAGFLAEALLAAAPRRSGEGSWLAGRFQEARDQPPCASQADRDGRRASDIGKAVAVGGTVAAAPVLPHGAAYNAYQNAKTDWNPRVVPQAKVGPPVYPATSKVEPMSILLCSLCDAGLVRRLK